MNEGSIAASLFETSTLKPTKEFNSMSEYEKKDLGQQGMVDKIKGKAKEVTGKAQKQMGKATSNRDQEIKGKAKELGGKAQGKSGDVERTIDKNLDR